MGNSRSSLADRPLKDAPTDVLPLPPPPPTPILRAGLDGVMYRECTMHAAAMRRGHNVAPMIPYERRVVRLALEELRDDKTTRVFSFRRSACAAAGQRVSVGRALLKADPAQVVGFACSVAYADGGPRHRVASGDMRDLALWNDVEDEGPESMCLRGSDSNANNSNANNSMHLLPVVPGYVPETRAELAYEFEVTMAPRAAGAAPAAEPVVYVIVLITDPRAASDRLSIGPPAFGGMYLKPTFARRAAGETGALPVSDGSGEGRLIAYVLVRTRAKLSRLAIVEADASGASAASREIVSVPADVARFDASARIASPLGDYYCVVLDGGTWTPSALRCETLRVGGALDPSALNALHLRLETEADDDGASDVRAMICEWVRS